MLLGAVVLNRTPLNALILAVAASTASTAGKYRPEHASALADLTAATGFAPEHSAALADLFRAGIV